MTLSHPGSLPTDRADLAALLLSPYGFQIDRHDSPVAWSSVTFDTVDNLFTQALTEPCPFRRADHAAIDRYVLTLFIFGPGRDTDLVLF